jgi:vanillate O-demethylase monooxygenase subunit
VSNPLLRHWHPLIPSRRLRERPLALTLAGEELVLFRDGLGRVAALRDQCPHRRMRLSLGKVEGGRIVCPYHGWSFDRRGEGFSPATPLLRVSAHSLTALDLHGAIWVKDESASPRFPTLGGADLYAAAVLAHEVEAPLELVLDNFTEVEHTPSTHALLGYDPELARDVETRVETTDTKVRVVNRGPQKRLPRVVEALFGIRSGDVFVDEWTTRFSPVHAVYDHWWEDPSTGAPRRDRLRSVVFFVPTKTGHTRLLTFTYTSAPPFGRLGLNLLLRPVVRALVDLEVRLDKRMVERIADKRTEMTGMKLGRFDKPLAESRRRIDRIYRTGYTGPGEPPAF